MWPFSRKPAPDAAALADRASGLAGEALGPKGEQIALRLLKRQGLKLLARNYRCPCGEADLIVLDRSTEAVSGAETIVFVEVKTRSSNQYTDPQSAVDADKQARLRRVARYYLSTRDADGFALRFDVVAIVLPPGGAMQVQHIPGAFE